MSDIEKAVQEALNEALAPTNPTPAPTPAPPTIAPHVAANIVEMLKRVQVTGPEAFAWVEAVQALQPFAAAAPRGAGVPFTG